ncbi:divergent polysaccharide deacetylase family protein [Hyphomonas sp. WL0036]|uniref:divergent polysaccharide deacetylase family protein n=1 Tax=Hyphomonas sediminis TaxID=2866160 RepID=UPI001C7F0C78|nr:divergent polysaccharide deacetylase family protein [Hyphomonas sediminis]MBY9066356.1 divergent polysaccharide deacetylase family protein [Hyphomonas sediminis]
MGHRHSEPSPIKTGLLHAGMSLGVFGGLAVALGTGIHITSDPAAAGPRHTIALFGGAAPDADEHPAQLAAIYAADYEEDYAATDYAQSSDQAFTYTELDGDGMRIDITGGQGGPAVAPAAGIRINGRLVQPGQSFGEVSSGTSEAAPATLNAAAKPASKAPADVYARPFSNPEGRPMVALVIGGLGINSTQTKLAIDSLPADVTLSFAPDASRLDYWVKTARADGHEVLIEVPMEAYEYGRLRMHPDTLTAAADKKANLAKLNQVLSRASGYFGVINYQGAKFASEAGPVEPVFDVLANRGLAFIDDGSVQKTSFGKVADTKGVRFARAAGPIDTRQSPQDIAAELMELETIAREHGGAIGAGFAFPVTLEAASLWIDTLDEKGLVLAPVSALVPKTAAPAPEMAQRLELRTGSPAKAGLKTGG